MSDFGLGARGVVLGRTGGVSYRVIARTLSDWLDEDWTEARARRTFFSVMRTLRARFGVNRPALDNRQHHPAPAGVSGDDRRARSSPTTA
jgi:hypothetical protein